MLYAHRGQKEQHIKKNCIRKVRNGRKYTTEVLIWVRKGLGSLSKYPHTQFLYLLCINLSINPLLMGQLWVSASCLRDANQDLKLRDRPLGHRCSSASEWLLKHRDACIDFSSSLKEKTGVGGSVSCASVCLDGGQPVVPGHPSLIGVGRGGWRGCSE